MEGVSVYACVDGSGSMQGSKIREVCSSLSTIIENCPDDVLFDIAVFQRQSRKMVTALKSGISARAVTKEILDYCNQGGGTALYDAWGEMLSSIPKSVLRDSDVHIFILTDGEDNTSRHYDEASVMRLTQEILKTGKVKFNFIQCGQNQNATVMNSLKQICPPGSQRVQSHAVANSAQGIKTALSSVQAEIMMSTKARSGTSGKTAAPSESGHSRSSNLAARSAASKLISLHISKNKEVKDTKKTSAILSSIGESLRSGKSSNLSQAANKLADVESKTGKSASTKNSSTRSSSTTTQFKLQ